MSDDRPRPEYGEYATPEEQARAAGQVYVPPAPRLPPPPLAANRHDGPVPPDGLDAPETPPVMSRGRFIDRIVTNGLLIIGVLAFIQSFSNDLQFGAFLGALANSVGVTDFTPTAAADSAGRWVLVANFVLLAAAIVGSVLLARRHIVTFWVPIAGYILFGIVMFAIVQAAQPGFYSELGNHFLNG